MPGVGIRWFIFPPSVKTFQARVQADERLGTGGELKGL